MDASAPVVVVGNLLSADGASAAATAGVVVAAEVIADVVKKAAAAPAEASEPLPVLTGTNAASVAPEPVTTGKYNLGCNVTAASVVQAAAARAVAAQTAELKSKIKKTAQVHKIEPPGDWKVANGSVLMAE